MFQVETQYATHFKSTGIEWTCVQILALLATRALLTSVSLNLQIWKMGLC